MPDTTQEEARLAKVKGDETRWWLCQGHGDADHATLVLGWSRMVRMYATECVNFECPPEALVEAEEHLTRDAGEWSLGGEGTASWHVSFEDGGYTVTLVTDASAIIAP